MLPFGYNGFIPPLPATSLASIKLDDNQDNSTSESAPKEPYDSEWDDEGEEAKARGAIRT